jgi:uncharacterized protein YfkK (UPF0435 family)
VNAQEQDELLLQAETLKNLLVSVATTGGYDDGAYRTLRTTFIDRPELKAFIPRFVVTCRTTSEFWGFIKHKFKTYHERREFLREEFDSLLSQLEASNMRPLDNDVAAIVSKPNAANVHEIWRKALERRTTDPEGAITTARTLLETVCKHILDEEQVSYTDSEDLPKLYGLVAKQLTLSPSQHTEDVFKRILGGCHSVVEGLGALRNKLGDAHGKGKAGVKPASRHAELAVNLAGAMATFLLETWEARKLSSQKQ